jgi:hypothetical protein
LLNLMSIRIDLILFATFGSYYYHDLPKYTCPGKRILVRQKYIGEQWQALISLREMFLQ